MQFSTLKSRKWRCQHVAEMISKTFWCFDCWCCFDSKISFGNPSCFICEISIHLIASLEAFDLDGFHYLGQDPRPSEKTRYSEILRDVNLWIWLLLNRIWDVQVIVSYCHCSIPDAFFSTTSSCFQQSCHQRYDQLNGSIVRRGETWWFLVIVLSPSHQKIPCKGCVSHHIIASIPCANEMGWNMVKTVSALKASAFH